MVTIEIDLNQIVDKSISAAVVLLCFFVGMRLLRLLAMQEGPKQRRMRPAAREPDPPATLKNTSTQRRIRLIARCPESTKHDYKLPQEPRRPAWLRLSQRQQSSLQT